MSDTEVFFNPFAEGFPADPYPQYAEMRAAAPVQHNPLGVWYAFDYDDVRGLLRDQSLSVDERHAHPTPITEMARAAQGDRADSTNLAMLNVDAPQHTRLRRLVSRAFTLRVIEELRGRIEEIVGATLDAAAEAGQVELMGGFAFPLPFTVITEMMGMPATDTVELRRLSGTLVRSLEPVVDPALLAEIVDAGEAMQELVVAAIEGKRSRPADDLLSALIAAEEDGDKLSTEELVAQVMLLYIAGHETTVNLVGNGILALLRHPAQLAALREDPSLDATFVDELLRYDSPVQMSRRITLEALDVRGQEIEPGAFVVLGLASANRDAGHWGPTADEVDLRRPGAGEHVSFGGGHHHCLGAALARLEGEVAISRFVRRFDSIEMLAEPTYNGRLNLRGLDSLQLAVRPS
jgi:cytochrome P450